MRIRLASSLFLVSFVVFCLAPPLFAEQIEIRFTGKVRYFAVDQCLNGAIEVGHKVQGSYAYERVFADCQEEHPSDCWGLPGYEVYRWCPSYVPPLQDCRYYYSSWPAGFRIVLPDSGLAFETDYTQDYYEAAFVITLGADYQDTYEILSRSPVATGGPPDLDPGYIGIFLTDTEQEDPAWTVEQLPTEAPDVVTPVWDVYPVSQGEIEVFCPGGETRLNFSLDTMVKENENLATEIEEAIRALDLPSEGVYDLLARFLTAVAKLDGDENPPSILKTYQACNELQALLEQLEGLTRGNRPVPVQELEDLIEMVEEYMGPEYVDCDNAPAPPFG